MFVSKLENSSTKIMLLAAFIAGGLSALAMAPFNLFPVLFVTLGVLYILTTSARSPRAAFAISWIFSFGYFVFGLYWVGNALMVDGNPYAWAWPLAVCGLPFLLAFFPAFGCFMARRFSNLKTIPGFIAFAAWLAFFEFARGHAFTGFPWNLYAHAWAGIPQILQVLSFSDIYFLNFATILWMSAPGFILICASPKKYKSALCAVLALVFVFSFSFGFFRLQETPPSSRQADIRIAQANIPQSEKWKSDLVWDHFKKRLALSKPNGAESSNPTYIIWPETALTHWILDDPDALAALIQLLSLYKGPAYILSGLLRHSPESGAYYNSLVTINKEGRVSDIYNKNHLVPFGEYIPFQKWIPLEPVAKFTGFSGGGRPRTLQTPEGIKYSPMICYEIIFSGAVLDESDRPDFILNITNDSWYGFSSGPHQHLAQAVFRAIEEGMPVVRVADTGISAVVDPYGRVVEKSALYKKYENTISLPGKLEKPGNTLLRIIVYLLLLLSCATLGYMSMKRYSTYV